MALVSLQRIEIGRLLVIYDGADNYEFFDKAGTPVPIHDLTADEILAIVDATRGDLDKNEK